MIISPETLLLLFNKGFLSPLEGDPNIYPTVLSAFPTNFGGLSMW